VTALRIRTLDGDLDPDDAGPILAHEHLHATFGAASDDPDLELVCHAELATDLRDARAAGFTIINDVTTEDMGADVELTAAVATEAGVRAIKSTGWFRSPTADRFVDGRSAAGLAERLIADLTEGFPGSRRRAGCVGEVGITGTRPTAAEQRVLDATAEAVAATGAAVVLHTDDARNACAAVDALSERGVPEARIQVGHARVSDPLHEQLELAERGCLVAFDQIGHPRRDPPAAVAVRIAELAGSGAGERIALSTDLGRRSRLTAFGGTGYVAGLLELLRRLVAEGLPEGLIESLRGGAAARFLAMPVGP